MAQYRFLAAGISILFAGCILFLLRRQRLNTMHSLWWLAVAIGGTMSGFFPGIVDFFGKLFGVHYPPVLLLIAVGCLLFIKNLTMDIERTRHERQIRLLSQRLAIIERRGETTSEGEGKRDSGQIALED